MRWDRAGTSPGGVAFSGRSRPCKRRGIGGKSGPGNVEDSRAIAKPWTDETDGEAKHGEDRTRHGKAKRNPLLGRQHLVSLKDIDKEKEKHVASVLHRSLLASSQTFPF
jgi:hypothetical protein